MASNLDINMNLLNEALKIGGFKTKKETVNKALEKFIYLQKQNIIIKYFGKVEFNDFNYKKQRERN